MRIAILTNEYPPHVYGGAGVHVEYLTRELAAIEGDTVEVMCFGDQRIDQPSLHVEGVMPPFTSSPSDKRHAKVLDTLAQDLAMAGRLTTVDIVHCHTWYSHFAGCLVKHLQAVPLVLTTHSLEPHRPWKAEQLGTAYRASTWIEQSAYQTADGVIAVSNAMRQDVHELYSVPLDRIRVIHNGIDLDQYRPHRDPDVLTRHGIDTAHPFVLFVGRITRQKGIIHLVRAIRYMNPELQVVLCAGAPDTPEIAREMTEAVERARAAGTHRIVWIQDMLPKEQVITLYTHAAVFVCPSVYEPFGIINLEAMACETPVVASAVGGIPEVVEHGDTGLLVVPEASSAADVEPKHPDRFARDLAAAVNTLMSDDDLRERMGRNARRRVEQSFSWTAIAAETRRFYADVIGRRSSEQLSGAGGTLRS
jgi:glycogen synthase